MENTNFNETITYVNILYGVENAIYFNEQKKDFLLKSNLEDRIEAIDNKLFTLRRIKHNIFAVLLGHGLDYTIEERDIDGNNKLFFALTLYGQQYDADFLSIKNSFNKSFKSFLESTYNKKKANGLSLEYLLSYNPAKALPVAQTFEIEDKTAIQVTEEKPVSKSKEKPVQNQPKAKENKPAQKNNKNTKEVVRNEQPKNSNTEQKKPKKQRSRIKKEFVPANFGEEDLDAMNEMMSDVSLEDPKYPIPKKEDKGDEFFDNFMPQFGDDVPEDEDYDDDYDDDDDDNDDVFDKKDDVVDNLSGDDVEMFSEMTHIVNQNRLDKPEKAKSSIKPVQEEKAEEEPEETPEAAPGTNQEDSDLDEDFEILDDEQETSSDEDINDRFEVNVFRKSFFDDEELTVEEEVSEESDEETDEEITFEDLDKEANETAEIQTKELEFEPLNSDKKESVLAESEDFVLDDSEDEEAGDDLDGFSIEDLTETDAEDEEEIVETEELPTDEVEIDIDDDDISFVDDEEAILPSIQIDEDDDEEEIVLQEFDESILGEETEEVVESESEPESEEDEALFIGDSDSNEKGLCPKCKKLLGSSKSLCPHCGYDLEGSVITKEELKEESSGDTFSEEDIKKLLDEIKVEYEKSVEEENAKIISSVLDDKKEGIDLSAAPKGYIQDNYSDIKMINPNESDPVKKKAELICDIYKFKMLDKPVSDNEEENAELTNKRLTVEEAEEIERRKQEKQQVIRDLTVWIFPLKLPENGNQRNAEAAVFVTEDDLSGCYCTEFGKNSSLVVETKYHRFIFQYYWEEGRPVTKFFEGGEKDYIIECTKTEIRPSDISTVGFGHPYATLTIDYADGGSESLGVHALPIVDAEPDKDGVVKCLYILDDEHAKVRQMIHPKRDNYKASFGFQNFTYTAYCLETENDEYEMKLIAK